MLGYLTMLLVISLILIAILNLVKEHIPLRPPIVYSTVGISFALGSVFPIAISNLTLVEVLVIYFGLITLIAIALSYNENRVYFNISPTPLKVADLEAKNLPEELVQDSFSSILAKEITALDACATLDNTGMPEEEPEAFPPQEMVSSAHGKDDPGLDVSTEYSHPTAEGSIEKENIPLEEELPLKSNVSMEDTSLIIEETPVKADLPESADEPTDKPVDVLTDELAEEPPDDLPYALPDEPEDDLPYALPDEPEDEPVDEPPDDLTDEPTDDIQDDLQDDLYDIDEKMPEEEMLYDINRDLPGAREEYPVQEVFSLAEKLPAGEKLPDQSGTAVVGAPPVWEEPAEDPIAPNRDNEKIGEDTMDSATAPVTVNDYISAGFKARTTGDLAGAVKNFITALMMSQEQQITAALSLEISAIYQELGQYFQAGMILRSVIKQKNIINDFTLRQKLQGQLIYLDTLCELLRITKMSNAPYSKIPNIIKIKANLETAEKLKEIT
ncbi:hypothetical protein Pmgp_01568 [Pelotomaculum propionicicum]|uniref:Uncharacterized protein n=1 Tax=Pelotomaculum propionicicum TaxID=258475 RepID=A0A4Y7RRB9_9FIRM|nr:hypothetical protein Pmgp_01568 [Pelotomaculum propionicicum]